MKLYWEPGPLASLCWAPGLPEKPCWAPEPPASPCWGPGQPERPYREPEALVQPCRAPGHSAGPYLDLELLALPLAGSGQSDPRQELIPHWSSRCPLVKSELVGDVSIDSVSEDSPDGSARPGPDKVRPHNPTIPSRGSLAERSRASPSEPDPQPARGTDHAGLGTVAKASSRSSWPTLALHPRGGHCGYRQTSFSRSLNLRKSRK